MEDKARDMKKRFLLFLCGCIVIRSVFVYVAKTIKPDYLPLLAVLALLPVIGWINIIFFNPRNSGPETMGSPIWWNSLRPIHAILYFAFALCAFYKKSYSWIFLLIDVCIGLSSFLIYHYAHGDFALLIQ